MKTFNNQIDLTSHFEGFSAKAYKCPAGVLTIGYGETMPNGKPVTQNMVCTEAQAKEWLRLNFSKIQAALYTILEVRVMDIEILDPLTDYAYNAGVNAFPTLLKKLKVRDFLGASLEFLDGIYVAKKPLLGLLLRRISEYNTFTGGGYVAFEKGDPISQDLKNKLLLKNAKNQDAVNMINQLRVKL